MEDAATAEIARAQVWQWVRHGRFSSDEVRRCVAEVDASPAARELFEEVALSEELVDFLTLPGYSRLL
jgi:malate synthase